MEAELGSIFKPIVGEDNFLDSEIDLEAYSIDASRIAGRPKAVVRPGGEDEVAEILSVASENGVPITPRGRGTSLVGGPVPLRGGVVLDMTRMTGILEVDEENGLVSAWAGTPVSELQDAIDGYTFPINPDGLGLSTLGGIAAEDSASMLSSIFGTARANVVGAEVVLPSGEIVDLGGKIPSGPRVALDTFLGSEGTLGVFIKLSVKLAPLPPSAKTVEIELVDAVDAIDINQSMRKSCPVPYTMEVIYRDVLDILHGEEKEAGAVARVGFYGSESCVQEAVDGLIREASKYHPLSTDVRDGMPKPAQRDLYTALERTELSVHVLSVAASLSYLRDHLQEIDRVSKSFNLNTVSLVNVPLGWILVGVLFDPTDRKSTMRTDGAVRRLSENFTRSGVFMGFGTGVGASMAGQIGRNGLISVYSHLKRALDPVGVMNPGKLVPL